MSQPQTITIAGAGVIGCAIAYELSRTTEAEILVLEKNPAIAGENQSSRNSGVVHAGVYYTREHEPLKARLCVEGNALLYEFCTEHDVPCVRCGKLVVAVNEQEDAYLDHVLETARDNGVPGVERISGAEAREREPNVAARTALLVPSSGIVEVTLLVQKLAGLARAGGAMFMTESEVTGIAGNADGCEVTVFSRGERETFDTDILINAAGLYSDEVARLADPGFPYVIEPVRGESARFYRNAKDRLHLNGMNVYPAPYGYYNDTGEKADVPLEEFFRLLQEKRITRTVGVHLTPTFDVAGDTYQVGNTVTIGPAKTVGTGKDNYGTGLRQPAHYHRCVGSFLPGLEEGDIQLHQAGIMAVLKNGRDFIIERSSVCPACINLVGIDSPGLSSCLAIAREVSSLVT